MWTQLISEFKALWRDGAPRLRRAVVHGLYAARALWVHIRPPILFVLQVIAALIVLFEEWGWRPLMELLGRLARFKPWAAMERQIAGLPPYGALAVFGLPMVLLFPLKFMALYLLAQGQALAAGGIFIAAKLASTAFIARIFMLTKPALMQIAWFARAYNWFMPWKEALFALIRTSWVWRYGRMVKTRMRLEAKQAWARWGPVIEAQTARGRVWLAGAMAEIRTVLTAWWLGAKPQVREQTLRLRLALRRAWVGLGRR